jgi:hypothetical protein
MPYDEQRMVPEMLQLAYALLQQTEQGKIKWATTDEENQYLFTSTKSSLLIKGELGSYDDENEGDFKLELLNRGGSVAGRLTIEYGVADSPQYGPTYTLMKKLYFEAESQALEIKTTLEDIRQTLGLQPSPAADSN